jgi:hypothetical protein
LSYSYVQHRKLQQLHRSRSNRAKRIDESLRAPMAKSAEQWMLQPNRFDVTDVDTPSDKASREEQERRFAEINRLEAYRVRVSRRDFRQRLNMHKYGGVTH